MPSGILSTILDTTGERIKERVEQSHALDKEMRDTQTQALLKSILATDENGNRKLSEPEAEEAWARVEKLHSHNKGVKDILAKARDITSKIFGGGQPNSAMAGRAQQQTTDVLAGGQGGSLVSAPVVSPQQGGPPPATELPAPPARTQAPAPIAGPTPPPQRSTASLIQAGAPNPVATDIAKENRANKEFVERQKLLHENAMELAKAKVVPKSMSYKGKDGLMHTRLYDPRNGDILGDVTSAGEIEEPRSWLTGAKIDAQNAKDRVARGEKFFFPDGTEINTAELQPNEELRAWAGGDAGSYGKYNQDTRQLTANNIVRTYPALNPNAQTVQGVARVGTVSTAEAPEIGPTGELNLLTTRQTNTPVTGAGPAPAQTAPSAAGPTPPPPRTEAPAAAPPGPQSRVIPDLLPAAERNNQLAVARPIRATAVQIWGSPDDPNVESLSSFARLADSEESKRKIGTAIRLTLGGMAKSEQAGGIGISAMGEGLSFSGGGLWEALKNRTGITNYIAETEAGAIQKAISALNDVEARAFAQMLAARGTVVGLRSLTRAGAYKFSQESIEKEIPIFGLVGVKDSTDFNNRLAKVGAEVVEGTKGISPSVLPERDYIARRTKELTALGQGKAPGMLPAPPPRAATTTDRIRVKGPNGESGTALKGKPLPPGWSEVK